MVCGSPLVYEREPQDRHCEFCGMVFQSNASCEKGHFVCDQCHAQDAVEVIRHICLQTGETDMVRLFERIRSHPSVALHGPEYHAMIPGIVLCTYRNLGGGISDKLIETGISRGKSIAGGFCGFMGVCGAAVGVGIAFSLILDANPVKAEERSAVQSVTQARAFADRQAQGRPLLPARRLHRPGGGSRYFQKPSPRRPQGRIQAGLQANAPEQGVPGKGLPPAPAQGAAIMTVRKSHRGDAPCGRRPSDLAGRRPGRLPLSRGGLSHALGDLRETGRPVRRRLPFEAFPLRSHHGQPGTMAGRFFHRSLPGDRLRAFGRAFETFRKGDFRHSPDASAGAGTGLDTGGHPAVRNRGVLHDLHDRGIGLRPRGHQRAWMESRAWMPTLSGPRK